MRFFSAFLICVLPLLAGCGPTTHHVKGTVTYDNTPVPEGEIIFKSKDGKGAPDAARRDWPERHPSRPA